MVSIFLNTTSFLNWGRQEFPLPSGLGVLRIQRENELMPVSSGEALEQVNANIIGTLMGDGFQIDYSLATDSEPFVSLNIYDVSVAWIVRWSCKIISYFAQQGAFYGFACDSKEYWHRNLLKYDLWGDGRLSTVAIGTNPLRIVPGLYWLNYFSIDYARRSRIDLNEIEALSSCISESAISNGLVQLFASPKDWADHCEVIDNYLENNSSFFSLKRIELPDALTPREYLEFTQTLHRRWNQVSKESN